MSLKDAREKAGLSQKDLSDAVGVSPAAICRYESGERVPKVQTAKRIAKIINIPWYELIDKEGR